MKRILFVDDEPNILQGLQRMLRPMRKEWDMIFVDNGQAALDYLANNPVDVIVSDMRMPKMDGAKLLTEVMRLYPQTIRFVLSGQSDKETIFRSIGPTHQFLAKPCDAETLRSTVNRAFALRDILQDTNLKRLVSQMDALPTMPGTYAQLVQILQSPDASVQSVAKIIENDVAMTAKILQWVNSAFFGIRLHVSNPVQAASLLGLETIRALVLMVGAFEQTTQKNMSPAFSIDALWSHSIEVGACARAVSKAENEQEKDIGDAFTAGLLHDVGQLILATHCAREYEAALATLLQNKKSLVELEMETFSTTHAHVGAYLLGLWGLPDPVVEAVAFHHTPQENSSKQFGPLAAVHVAEGCAHPERIESPKFENGGTVDMLYLESLGRADRLPAWSELCNPINTCEESKT